MIAFLDEKYKRNGEWIITKRNKTVYYDNHGNAIDGIIALMNKDKLIRKENIEFEISEGDTSDYWLETAANAIRPLYQMIALAKMKPDCIWGGD